MCLSEKFRTKGGRGVLSGTAAGTVSAPGPNSRQQQRYSAPELEPCFDKARPPAPQPISRLTFRTRTNTLNLYHPAVVIIGLLISGLGSGCEEVDHPNPPLAFDTAIWKSGTTSRYEMIPSLQESDLKPGISEAKVASLLGPPDRRFLADEFQGDSRGADILLFYELDSSTIPNAFDSAYFIVFLSSSRGVIASDISVN